MTLNVVQPIKLFHFIKADLQLKSSIQ